jgi:UDP-N-acetylmuramate: L-alanyl-gamma-D-glutamyl-meso-diaminopimelate ligase
LVACFELHTYSSLNKDFLSQYAGSMEQADISAVYFSPHALELKKLPMLFPEDIKTAFRKPGMLVFSDTGKFQEFLLSQDWADSNLLLMSSGNFDGMNVKEFAEKIVV